MINLEGSIRTLFWNYCNLETSMVSVERCYAFTEIIQEAENARESDKSEWPRTGAIQFQNYFVKYRPTTELILKDLTFSIRDRERIGIVGRTGSGKSTLCLSLLRILEAHSGRILIDGENIADLGLQKLRSAITIIPQDPTLFEGSLKFNLNPYGDLSDEEVMRAVQKANLDQILKYEGDILNFMVSVKVTG